MQALTVRTQAYTQVGARALTFSVGEVVVGLSYWNPTTGAFQSSPPGLTLGQTGIVRFLVTNNTGSTLYIRSEADIRKPDGSSSRQVGETLSVAAGASQEWGFFFTADQVGTWQHNVAVYAGLTLETMSLTVSQGWTNAAVVTAVAAGAITNHEFQNPASGAWQTTAPSYIVGDTLNLRAYARNDSGASMRARVDAVVTNPAGTVTTFTGAVALQAAGETGYWAFSNLLYDAGTWSISLRLYGELA